MEVLLKKDVSGVGKEGQKVNVSRGFARNFLLPQGIAMEVTSKNLERLKYEQKLKEQKEIKVIKDAQEVVDKLENISCTIPVKTGAGDKMFGSVTSEDIAQALSKEGMEIDRKDILLGDPIKELGVYNIEVKVYPRLKAKIKIWVVKE